jgi:hypothetical protein
MIGRRRRTLTIILDEYYKFYRNWHQNQKHQLRLGQAFWNKYLTHATQEEDILFYEPNTGKAEEIIFKHYITELKNV